MSTRNVMPPDQEQAIQNLAQFGRYQNAGDVMRAGWRLLRSLPGQLRLHFSDGI
ncbi:Arc/MetJ-type ribon-helix-helix transcriptional regulator [Pseudomonas marginalis]|nr:Arc/MetJ-type ribon-helix-helix transcriptional regulator [Pseudomonas marginalis]MCP1523436.1 Arc/MetJ-type ribon-helix-helix transcriptional regulator [Pseudomonas marginalis]MDQ0501801.1 Arc/MetJ-type ribon-helix-helix transcriptional regulator [Pseudomonas marginalis]